MKDFHDIRRIHLIGIGGAGMSAIAQILIHQGHEVSGSDLNPSPVTERLTRSGATIHRGHRADNLNGAELVVTSTAIDESNLERREAEARGIPIWRRARMLSEIMGGGKGLAVCGTHGKTTTSTMMAMVLIEAGMDPTAMIGGEVGAFGGNARMGRGEWIVAEADESDASMLDLAPDRVIVTNIEAEHLDFYRDLDDVVQTFGKFLDRLRPGGKVAACIDSPPLRDLLKGDGVSALTYSLEDRAADLFAEAIQSDPEKGVTRFTPIDRGEPMERMEVLAPGRHNVANALAVMLMARDLGCPIDAVRRALAECPGPQRRFQFKGRSHGITVVDDYAHHPTEIRATLAAARDRIGCSHPRRIVSVFQPHRYSRTARMAIEFGKSFRQADLVVVTDVYAAGEKPIEGVSGCNIFDEVITSGHPDAHYVPDSCDVAEFLRPRLQSGDMVLTLGAGDVWRVGENLLTGLQA